MPAINHDSHFPGGVNPFPASPSRKPTCVAYITNPQTGKLWVQNYSALYAMRKLFDAIGEGHTFKQHKQDEGVFSDGLTFKSAQLNDILEYEYTRSEDLWSLPDRDMMQLRMLRGEVDTPTLTPSKTYRSATSRPTSNKTPREALSPVERVNAASKSIPAGYVSLQSICADISIDPKHARSALRAAGAVKSEHGWVFAPDQIDAIKTTIIEGAKK